MTGRHRAGHPRRRGAATVGLVLVAVVVAGVAVAPQLLSSAGSAASQLQAGPDLAVAPSPTSSSSTTAPATTSPATTAGTAPRIVAPVLPTTAAPAPVATTTAKPKVTSNAPSPALAPREEETCRTSGFGGVKLHVAIAAWHVIGRFGLNPELVYGVAGRTGVSDHPLGLAVDFMVDASGSPDKELGDGIAAYVIERHTLLAVKYVIWRQRIAEAPTWAWKAMEDRGSPTANHMDHVHVSFEDHGSGGLITC